MKTVLYKTTRGWNIGYELILRGTINLIKATIGEHNAILYNCHPSIDRQSIQRDDSVFGDYDPSIIDLAVIAGTPETFTKRMRTFYEIVNNNKIPLLILGAGDIDFTTVSEMANPAKLITVRQEDLIERYSAFFGRSVKCMPCPALFAANELSYGSNGRYLFVYDAEGGWQGIGEKNYATTDDCFDYFEKRVDFDVVCHRCDELPLAKKRFPKATVRYFYNVNDLIDFYGNYSFVISPRIHGCGLAASFGIPSLCTLVDDFRLGAVDGFLSFIPQDIKNINSETILKRSTELAIHKAKTEAAYIKLLSPLLV